MRLSIAIEERQWRQLRDLAEVQRNGGRASVSRLIRVAVDRLLAEAHGESEAGSSSSVRDRQTN